MIFYINHVVTQKKYIFLNLITFFKDINSLWATLLDLEIL